MFIKLQSRTFSTTTHYLNIIRPALQLYGINGRYAHALYSAAYKEKKLETVEKELKNISEILVKDQKFASTIYNPLIPRKLKKEFFMEYMKKKNVSNIAASFFSLIVDNGRYSKIPSILKAFEQIMQSHRGEVAAEIVTAKPLDKELLKEVETALQALIKKGEILKLTTKVDPGIIGGMIVRVGDKHIDMSMSSKLNTFKSFILHPV